MYDKINDVTLYNMTDGDKFVYLMKKHWKQLSQYIETAWDYRNSILYKQNVIDCAATYIFITVMW